MQFREEKTIKVHTHYKVSKVVDGDGLFVYNIFNKKETEIRLLGIDAPEIKDCRKLRQDERELHQKTIYIRCFQKKQILHLLRKLVMK